MSFSVYQTLDHGITRIDTGMVRDELAACYLLEQDNEIAIIETGTHFTVPTILNLLQEKSIDKSQVKYVIPTHVHLDHAGGVGGLMQELPNATAVIHPSGARHMINPEKLKAGTIAVYGEQGFKNMYGDLIPVPADRVMEASENTILSLGNRFLRVIDTPGHARHHFCIYDEVSQGIFTGDTFGISYPNLRNNNQCFVFPTTTPVQFEPDALKNSIGKLFSYSPERMYLTHYGMIERPSELKDMLLEQIDEYVAIAKSCEADANPISAIQKKLTSYTLSHPLLDCLQISEQEKLNTITMDMALNSQGLNVWLDRQR